MQVGAESIGRWGGALLIAAGAAGLALGAHGWASRHVGSVPDSLASHAQAAARGSHPTQSSPAGRAPPSTRPSTPGAAQTGKPGPLLSSMPYAAYAYQIYPGTPSAAARQAQAGLTITIRQQGGNISITAAVNGGPVSQPHLFAASDRVYIVESALSDDSGATDYNLGDDSLVVTDSGGRIVQ